MMASTIKNGNDRLRKGNRLRRQWSYLNRFKVQKKIERLIHKPETMQKHPKAMNK